MPSLLPLIALVLLGACRPDDRDRPAGGDDTAGSEDSGGSDGGGDSGDPFCADVPTLTWDNFGRGFVTEHCQGCHASTAVNRYDAPEDVTFDTAQQTWQQAIVILAVATGDAVAMPPAGGVPEDERTKLEWWLRCGTVGS